MTYTTDQLIEIIDSEMMAHIKGEREFVRLDRIEEKFAAITSYHEVREQVHAYQKQHGISGVVVETRELPDGSVIRFPVQHDQLDLVDGDMQVLEAARFRVVEAFLEQIAAGQYYLCYRIESRDGGEWDMETTPEFIRYFIQGLQWAEISMYDSGELVLQVGYGEPHESAYIAGKNCECWFFYAQSYCRNLGVK
ncbi:hypothetical protein N836_31495 [Leptolyngbya sp. Heron Island J]|uniref:hypothetical protein n=1 Tax=Leptolyngbya sp. Heron Island J TaxID=1385935 RepID=UPI0003B990FF|nr:hypothetical protein [Leptolyngbya sp. Heron Island J]ESA38467.1 hypothetical protein N836_31495 [Leptolyngbya sp. Heron Island J]